MNKIGILTGVLLMVFGTVEKMTFIFYFGMGLMLLFFTMDVLRGKLRKQLDLLTRIFHIRELERYRKQNNALFQKADEWIDRFSARYQATVQSTYALTSERKLNVHPIHHEKEDGEAILAEFILFLRHKGLQLREEWLRVEINDRVLRRKFEQFQTVISTITEHKPKIETLLRIFVEEGSRAKSIDSHQTFWNREMLLYYIQISYLPEEIEAYFSDRFRSLRDQITRYLQKFEREYALKLRLDKMEEWLIGAQGEVVLTIQYFDQCANNFTNFRMGVVYLLEKIGYRVTLPTDPELKIDLIIERVGMEYGVVIRALEENHNIPLETIHEIHTTRTLAHVQSVMLVTNRDFEVAAKTLALKLGLICIDREKLNDWITHYTTPYPRTS